MVGSRSISSSLNARKLLGGTNILQIKRKENVKHTTERTKGMRNIDANGKLTHSQITSWSISYLESQY
jgi:hypothetical protein